MFMFIFVIVPVLVFVFILLCCVLCLSCVMFVFVCHVYVRVSCVVSICSISCVLFVLIFLFLFVFAEIEVENECSEFCMEFECATLRWSVTRGGEVCHVKVEYTIWRCSVPHGVQCAGWSWRQIMLCRGGGGGCYVPWRRRWSVPC